MTIKLAQTVTALICLACITFGFGTAWFIVGMFVGVASLILDGLARAISPKMARINRDIDTLRNMPRGRVHSEIVHHHPPSWQHRPQGGPYGAVWPNESGAPE